MTAFRGVFTIPSTPFRANGAVDEEGFRRIVDFCIECGAHGLAFPLNASEWMHLSDNERFGLTEILLKQTAGRLPVIVGVTAATKELAAGFARHAGEHGADAVVAMPPHVRRKPFSEEVIADYYRAISDAARAPVMIQNWSGPIGTEMSPGFLLRLCRDIEHVCYVKEETEPCTVKLTAVLEGGKGSVDGCFGARGGRYLIEEHRRGCAGNMPGCHVTDVVVKLWNTLESGDEEAAIEIHKEMAPLFFFEEQAPGVYKEVLRRRGVVECAKTRNGWTPLDAVASQYLDDILAGMQPLMSWGA